MKKFLQFCTGALCAAFVFAVAALFTAQQDVHAAINRADPLPMRWGSGTNAFGLTAAGVPQVTLNGTNYTGITTNLAITNGVILRIVNGVATGFIAP